ncbi:MAG: hypothetical protein ACXVIA_07760 [Halobacteriota archaeon]
MNADSFSRGVSPKTSVSTRLAISILAFAMFLVIYTQALMVPVLPTLEAEFATTETWTAWTLRLPRRARLQLPGLHYHRR